MPSGDNEWNATQCTRHWLSLRRELILYSLVMGPPKQRCPLAVSIPIIVPVLRKIPSQRVGPPQIHLLDQPIATTTARMTLSAGALGWNPSAEAAYKSSSSSSGSGADLAAASAASASMACASVNSTSGGFTAGAATNSRDGSFASLRASHRNGFSKL